MAVWTASSNSRSSLYLHRNGRQGGGWPQIPRQFVPSQKSLGMRQEGLYTTGFANNAHELSQTWIATSGQQVHPETTLLQDSVSHMVNQSRMTSLDWHTSSALWLAESRASTGTQDLSLEQWCIAWDTMQLYMAYRVAAFPAPNTSQPKRWLHKWLVPPFLQLINGVNPVLVNNTQYKEYKDTLRVDTVNQNGVGSNFKILWHFVSATRLNSCMGPAE